MDHALVGWTLAGLGAWLFVLVSVSRAIGRSGGVWSACAYAVVSGAMIGLIGLGGGRGAFYWRFAPEPDLTQLGHLCGSAVLLSIFAPLFLSLIARAPRRDGALLAPR